nr:hypothetical protein [Dickeya sp. CFBP 2040]
MRYTLLFALLFGSSMLTAQAASTAAPDLKGFGTETVAGSGGKIIRVTKTPIPLAATARGIG